jgi:hypothetical protein
VISFLKSVVAPYRLQPSVRVKQSVLALKKLKTAQTAEGELALYSLSGRANFPFHAEPEQVLYAKSSWS